MRILRAWPVALGALLSASAAQALPFAGSAPAADSAVQQPVKGRQLQERPNTNAAPAAAGGPVDAHEVEAFLDGVMAAALRDHHVVGATVALVRNGSVLFEKGYGWSNEATRKPVDAERTLFRVGSISKLFTFTAVMQLVEQGKLDLDKDVSSYLEFTIPATFQQPITLRHLLTHTPGFEDRNLGLFNPDTMPRGEWLARNIPARVRPPGQLASYSNFGAALAGHIVERVSGESWEDYIASHILQPLGMQYATGKQPLPAALAPWMSTGYGLESGHAVEKPFEVLQGFAPAGSVSASAGDIARFMIAHLQDGEYNGARILEARTAQQMHARAFGHDDRLNGYALGFYEKSSHGLRIIGHGGDTQWFHSDLALIPAEQLGLFVSFNTSSGSALSFGPFLEMFLDHYYPQADTLLAADSTVDLSRFAGSYRSDRRSYTTFEKFSGLFGDVEISWDHKGHLIAQTPIGEIRSVQVGKDLFQRVDKGERMAFREDASGRVTWLFLDQAPMLAFQRVRGLDSGTLHAVVLIAGIALLLSVLLAAPVRWLLGRRFAELRPGRGPARRARQAAFAMSLLFLLFGVGLALATTAGQTAVIEGHVRWVALAMTLGVAGAVLAIPVVVYAVRAWTGHWWGFWGRLHYTLLTLGVIAFIWSLNYWRLLGWHF